jgi:hypothetical protein
MLCFIQIMAQQMLIYFLRRNTTPKGESTMKKVFSTIVAALVAVSFAGIVCAAEPAAPALPAGHPPVADKAPAKPAKKVKKAKKAVKKEAAKPAEAPAAPAVK